jgi:uncharacterized membrane protein YhhN
MKTSLYLLPLVVIVVFFLVAAEMRGNLRARFILKPLATLLVIAVTCLAFLEPTQNPIYTAGVLIGLIFSFGGDVALMFENRRAFLLGLVLFLLAHIAYTITFTALTSFSTLDLVSTLILVVLGVGFYRLIAPNLGTLRVPVIVYIVVISVMVNRAIAALASPMFSHVAAVMIALGAILFYVSDMLLAAARFWKPFRYHRISLAFYYAGQLLLALAASYFV